MKTDSSRVGCAAAVGTGSGVSRGAVERANITEAYWEESMVGGGNGLHKKSPLRGSKAIYYLPPPDNWIIYTVYDESVCVNRNWILL